MHPLIFEPRTPGSNALTLAVQHVAAAAEKEQEKKRRTPAPTPGRPCPHHLLPAPWRGSLHTLRGPLRAANSRFHHAGESGGPTVSACAFLLQLYLSLCPAHEQEEVRAERSGLQRRHLRASPVKQSSELREFAAVTADKLHSSRVQNSAGSGRKRKEEEGGGRPPHQQKDFPSLVLSSSRCNGTAISICCGGVRVSLRPAIPHFHLDWSEWGINTFECVIDLSAYSLAIDLKSALVLMSSPGDLSRGSFSCLDSGCINREAIKHVNHPSMLCLYMCALKINSVIDYVNTPGFFFYRK